MSGCETWPAAFVKLRGVALDPAEHRRRVDVEAALQQEFFDVMVAQGIPEIPSHPTDNDLRSKVAPCKQRGGSQSGSPVIREKS